MASFNKVFLLGNLTRDPQLTYTPSQTAVVDFGLATNRKWKAQDGSDREEVCFVDCRAFGKTAENINKFLAKGSPVFVEGRLTFDQWTAQDGSKKSKHRVTVDTVQFLGGNRSNDRDADQAAEARALAGAPAAGGGPQPDPDSDIPF
jgi:single-strand DNA-binding protein